MQPNHSSPLSPPGDPILEASHVSVTFSSLQGELGALGDVSFQATKGEFICFVGPSGCGKSTLLRVLSGLLRPTSGSVRLYGMPLAGPSQEIGFVFQRANLMPWRTALKNVTLPLEMRGLDKASARRPVAELIHLVGLEGFEHSYPHELSGGMAQRVAIARALIYDPEVLLLDEPFGSLDALTRERMNLELLRIWEAEHKTVIMVTHNIQEAIMLSDRVMVMTARPGQITAEEPVPLPRPRFEEMVYSDEFIDLTRRIREAIEQETRGET